MKTLKTILNLTLLMSFVFLLSACGNNQKEVPEESFKIEIEQLESVTLEVEESVDKVKESTDELSNDVDDLLKEL